MKTNKITIPWARPALWGKEQEYVLDALHSTWISGGPYVDKLEKEFSRLFKMKALTVSNGTTAIMLAYLGIGIQPGDEIIVPGFAFMAAANLALHFKAVPVFAEVDPQTWCLTAGEIEKKINSRTKAIVPVHTYGNVCDMDSIMKLAKARGIKVIEDCAESLFSRLGHRFSGTFGYVNCFSLHSTKTITTGEGGFVTTTDESTLKNMALYRNHGLSERGSYNHQVPGYNFRLSNLQAALGLAQFEYRERVIEERKRIHARYKSCLDGIDGISLQHFDEQVEPVLWAFALKLSPQVFPPGRDGIIQKLLEKGIETRPGFTPSSRLKIYSPHRLPVCEELGRTVMSLPTYATLTDNQIEFICGELRKLAK